MEELLKPREGNVLILRARGLTLKEIGTIYGVGPERARQVLQAACKALGATEPVHALAIALTVGILTVDDLGGSSGRDSYGELRIPQHVREATATGKGHP